MKPRTDFYFFIFGGREFQTDDPENAKHTLYRSMRVRGKTHFGLISSRRSVTKVAYILRRPTHMDFKHKHSCVVYRLFLQWKNSGKHIVFCLAVTTLRETVLTNFANKLIISGVEL